MPFEQDDTKWVNPHNRRLKQECPYSYSEFFLFGGRDTIGKSKALYSDRIFQAENAKELWKDHVNSRWDNAPIEKLNEFLSAFLDKQVTITALAEGCNFASGYPYWIVWFT